MSNQNNTGSDIFNNVRQWVSKLAGSNLNTNDVLKDGRPVTNNRFGNMAQNNNTNNMPYYVSGTPMTENTNSATIGGNNSVPYNGNFQPVRTSTFMHQMDCPGKNFWTLKVSSPNDCQNQCISRENCKMWSFDNRNQNCFLKNDIMPCNSDNDYISGRISVRSQNNNIINNSTPPTIPVISPTPAPNYPTPYPSPNYPSPNYPSPTPSPNYPTPYPTPTPAPNYPTPYPNYPTPTPYNPNNKFSTETPNVNVLIPSNIINTNKTLPLSNISDCKNACIADDRCGQWNFLPENSNGTDRCLLITAYPINSVPVSNGATGIIYNKFP
ncbi:hypothetical protein QJ854_gp232 [Moumouvirus goulette]|uniref:Apple domain-containing protein n=1 Tax=Moumouvirus goulette TaxID=1247379 RepID=M1NNC1_9VIRU|nr:hypothetical protein QJ854_gp232 [Moumouvirus goulette]AGF85550.1 hypothetical protein glt_00745 [Moumouvirus goulette]